MLVALLCPTLCDPMGCSLPGPSVCEIFQARILEWVAIPSSGDLPNPGIEAGAQADSLPPEPPGKPYPQSKKRQLTEWQEIFANHVSDKGLISEYIENF